MSKVIKCISLLVIGLLSSYCSVVAEGQKASSKTHDGTDTRVPLLTQKISCTAKHVYGCNWMKPYCTDEGFAMSGDPGITYELDLLNRVGRLKGEKGVAVQINTLSAIPGSDVVNIQGVSEEWLPWTLSFEASTGKGFLTQVSPNFTAIYLVNCMFGTAPQ
jgi:hypothetical protein